MIFLPAFLLAVHAQVAPAQAHLSGDSLVCRDLVAAYMIPRSENRHPNGVDAREACRAVVVAARAFKNRFHRNADSISWQRVDVPDLDTKKITSYYHFVFAVGRQRPNVIVDRPSFRVRIMEAQ